MHIANPIYDVVFKYLMEDARLAKLLLSSIIGTEIERLSFLPQEFVGDVDTAQKAPPRRRSAAPNFTVYRLDFSAKIKTPEGAKQVIIELQKAKFPTDIMRFRRYLGAQFSNKQNIQKVKINGKYRKTGLPIISIYFLDHKLDHTTASAIRISRTYQDLITHDVIETKEAFIESLTLDSYVIQIPYLTDKRRNDLEILLSVFDQRNSIDPDHHILNVDEKDFPEKYRPIIRKLQQAHENSAIRKNMELEDGILDELEDLEREITALEETNERIAQEKEQIAQEKEQIAQENERLRKEIAALQQLK